MSWLFSVTQVKLKCLLAQSDVTLKMQLIRIYNYLKKVVFLISNYNVRWDITHPNTHIDVVSTKYEVTIIA